MAKASKILIAKEQIRKRSGVTKFDYWAANMQKNCALGLLPWNPVVATGITFILFFVLKKFVRHASRLESTQYTDNPLVIPTLKIWQQIKQHFGWLRLMPGSLIETDKISIVKAHSPASLSCMSLSIYNNLTFSGTFKFEGGWMGSALLKHFISLYCIAL